MKSIVEEASSIAKAIEQAWNRAGNPAQFSITVFEEPKKSMFGFTVQSAKIGLMFDERAQERAFSHPSKEKRPVPSKNELPPAGTAPLLKQKQRKEMWPSDMVDFAKGWIRQVLNLMGLSDMQFSVSISGNLAKFHFTSHVTGKESSDRMLFSSFSHLIMTALRQKYKKSLQHIKIVLISS